MKYLKNYLELTKLYRAEIKNTKIFLLIIANLWLLLIFWKILLISDMNIVNNNATLNKATLFLQPILSILGIDVLSPNMLKMMVLTFIIMTTNLSILYFNQMASIIILSVFARYSYKSYTNYLINQGNLNYLGFESKKEIIKQSEPSRIVIESTPVVTEAANHTHWGVWLAMGLAVVVCFGLLVYSHNSLSDNLIETNNSVIETNNNLKAVNNNLSERITRGYQQMDLNSEHSNKMIHHMDTKINLIDKKVINMENTVQNIGENLVKVNELTNQNVLKLSQQSINLSQEAADSLREISETTSSVEAISVGFARVWEIVKGLGDRVEVAETRIDSLAGSNTPRSRIGNMVLNTNPLSNIRKTNE